MHYGRYMFEKKNNLYWKNPVMAEQGKAVKQDETA